MFRLYVVPTVEFEQFLSSSISADNEANLRYWVLVEKLNQKVFYDLHKKVSLLQQNRTV